MRAIVMAFWIWMLVPSIVLGQQAPEPAPTNETSAVDSQPAPAVDPLKLPVNLGRIRLELAHKPPTKSSGLRISETIEVVGVAPKVQLWNPETAKLATGPVPYGAPTHKDFIDLHTPEEFKRYPMDLNALMKWLMEKLADDSGTRKTQ